MAKRKMIPTPADNIAKQIMETYHPQDAQEIQDIVKRIFAPIFEAALKGEMQNHLGYANHERTISSGNARNGYSEKTLKTTFGEVPIHVPRDRQGSFEPQIVKKHQRDVSSIEGKVLALYGRGMSQRDIAATVEDIYGFKMSHEQISHITDCIMEQVMEWRNRPLKPFYPFVFVDCLYVSLRTATPAISSSVLYFTIQSSIFCMLSIPHNKKDSPQAAFVCYNILGATKTVGGRFLAPERGVAHDDKRFNRVALSDAVHPRRFEGIRNPACS